MDEPARVFLYPDFFYPDVFFAAVEHNIHARLFPQLYRKPRKGRQGLPAGALRYGRHVQAAFISRRPDDRAPEPPGEEAAFSCGLGVEPGRGAGRIRDKAARTNRTKAVGTAGTEGFDPGPGFFLKQNPDFQGNMGFIHQDTSKKSILLKKLIANFVFPLYNKKNCGAIPDFLRPIRSICD
jgi:hypothetical protein